MQPSCRRAGLRLAVLAFVLPLVAACATAPVATPQRAPGNQTTDRTAVILAVNDVYRIEGVEGGEVGGLARLRTLREELERESPDLLLLHGGDFLYPSFLSRTYDGEQMVDVMNLLDGDGLAFDSRMFVTLGNHELEKKKLQDAGILDSRIEQSKFTWLGGNVNFVPGQDGAPVVAAPNLERSAIIESGGIKIGLFGLTIPTAGVQYVQSFADPVETAKALSADLRARGAEVVVGITHLNARDDRRLLETLGKDGPDVIFGGHDHERMACTAGERRALKADADIRTATVARLTLHPGGKLDLCWEFREMESGSPAPDPAVEARVADWLDRHEKSFCEKAGEPAGCLEEVYGWTQTVLEAEESKIRGRETSLGDWIADRMVAAFAGCGAQAAFINAGTLRLNQDLPAGARLTRRTVEELFGFPAPLHLLHLDGKALQQVAEHALVGWPGAGNWLQVSGISYVHDTGTGTIRDLSLKAPDGTPHPVRPDDQILVVTNDYLVSPSGDQDGYTMLNPSQIVRDCAADRTDLKVAVTDALKAAAEEGIEPELEGRIQQIGEAAEPPCTQEERRCGR